MVLLVHVGAAYGVELLMTFLWRAFGRKEHARGAASCMLSSQADSLSCKDSVHLAIL